MSRPSARSVPSASHAGGSQSIHAILVRERDKDTRRDVLQGIKDVGGTLLLFSPSPAGEKAGALWRDALSLARRTPDSPADLALYCKTIIECGSIVTKAKAASVTLLEEIYSIGGVTTKAATARVLNELQLFGSVEFFTAATVLLSSIVKCRAGFETGEFEKATALVVSCVEAKIASPVSVPVIDWLEPEIASSISIDHWRRIANRTRESEGRLALALDALCDCQRWGDVLELGLSERAAEAIVEKCDKPALSALLCAVSNPVTREKNAVTILPQLLRAERMEEALSSLTYISASKLRDQSCGLIVLAYLQRGRVSEARSFAAGIEDPKTRVLAQIHCAVRNLGEERGASIVSRELDGLRARVDCEFPQLANLKTTTEAWAEGDRLSYGLLQLFAQAWSDVFDRHLGLLQFPEALEVIPKIPDERILRIVIGEFCDEVPLSQKTENPIGMLEEALRLVEGLEDLSLRDLGCRNVLRALAYLNDRNALDVAFGHARRLDREDRRSLDQSTHFQEYLCGAAAFASARIGDFRAARGFLDSIVTAGERQETIHEIAMAAIAHGCLDEATMTAQLGTQHGAVIVEAVQAIRLLDDGLSGEAKGGCLLRALELLQSLHSNREMALGVEVVLKLALEIGEFEGRTALIRSLFDRTERVAWGGHLVHRLKSMLRLLEQHSFVRDLVMLVSFAKECLQRPEFRPSDEGVPGQSDSGTPTTRELMDLARRREAKRSGRDKSDAYSSLVRALVNFKKIGSRVPDFIPLLVKLAGMSKTPEAVTDSVSAVLRLVSDWVVANGETRLFDELLGHFRGMDLPCNNVQSFLGGARRDAERMLQEMAKKSSAEQMQSADRSKSDRPLKIDFTTLSIKAHLDWVEHATDRYVKLDHCPGLMARANQMEIPEAADAVFSKGVGIFEESCPFVMSELFCEKLGLFAEAVAQGADKMAAVRRLNGLLSSAHQLQLDDRDACISHVALQLAKVGELDSGLAAVRSLVSPSEKIAGLWRIGMGLIEAGNLQTGVLLIEESLALTACIDDDFEAVRIGVSLVALLGRLTESGCKGLEEGVLKCILDQFPKIQRADTQGCLLGELAQWFDSAGAAAKFLPCLEGLVAGAMACPDGLYELVWRIFSQQWRADSEEHFHQCARLVVKAMGLREPRERSRILGTIVRRLIKDGAFDWGWVEFLSGAAQTEVDFEFIFEGNFLSGLSREDILKIGVLSPYSGELSLRVACALLSNALGKEDAAAVVAISQSCLQLRLTDFVEQYYAAATPGLLCS